MAITLPEKRFVIDLRAVVQNATASVQASRRQAQARMESEFQRAVADGLSYEEQITIRKRQIDKARQEGAEEAYITKLEEAIASTKKLQRFNNYRTTYSTVLGELSAGKINEEEYLSRLERMLSTVNDDELRLEIQQDITAARKQVKEYHDTILANQVKKLRYDGTQKSLTEAIAKVKSARYEAALDKNDDEVTAYDETLAALNSQFSTVKIQDAMTGFQVKSSTRGTSPIEKLNFINAEIRKADSNTPIKIGDRSYASASEFWLLERDSYLAGTSDIFGNFFNELETESKNAIAANTAQFGYPTQTVLDKNLSVFNDVRARAEVQPFLGKLDITQATVMSNAIDLLAKTINAVGSNNLTFKEADVQLQAISKKYGIDTTGYRLQLQEEVISEQERNKARGIESNFELPEVELELPKIDGKDTGSTPNVITPDVASVLAASRTVKAGDTLSGIALENNTSIQELLNLNPELKANPNLIRVGQTVKLPDLAIKPKEEPVVEQPKTTTTKKAEETKTTTTQPKTTTTTQPKSTSSTTTTQPKTQAASPSSYTGVSIVDYLASEGLPTDYNSRTLLAKKNGISGYTGTADQNTQLLKKLRGF